MKRVDLHGAEWTIEACGDVAHVPSAVRGRALAARVPGCVHTDLIRAGVIGHPNLAFNEEACQWVGRTDWRYRCRFDVDAETLAYDRVDLVLDGLDTIAAIEVNGLHADGPRAMNMHHAHRFSVKPLLQVGVNELTIELRGPVSYVDEQEARLGQRPVNGDWTPYCYARKMASNFQWDWGPRVATCGIWRGARLEAWNGARIVSVRPMVLHARDRESIIDMHVSIEFADAGAIWDFAEVGIGRAKAMVPLKSQSGDRHARAGGHPASVHASPSRRLGSRLRGNDDEASHLATTKALIQASAFTGDSASVRLELADAELWWPRGLGKQTLHSMVVSLHRGRERLDECAASIGLRMTRLLTSPDEHGSAFAIEINGQPIFCKGANWIPEGLFPEDQSPQRIRARVQQAADANVNMLRVWGGGTYEQDEFYNACDELGIMVWQDFMFACATYPEDKPYPELIEREAREAISRLAHHPSIVLWCGGNENVLGYESWGWKQRMPRPPSEQKWGERYFFDILPRVVRELDPSRPYWPDSPHSSDVRTEVHPNDPDLGDRHTWDAKVEGYRDLVPRFCSEFGHQSPPCWATMRDAWGEDQLHIDSRAMFHRQRATGGNEVWYGEKVLGHRFRQPRDFDEWLYLAHLLQARAMSIGIEWLRANQPRCMGALFWQLNDAWAGHSWSCIDSAGRRKPAWYAIRRSFSPRLLTIQPLDGALRVCAVNDEAIAWEIVLRVRRMDMSGSTLAEQVERLIAPPGAVGRSRAVFDMVGRPQDERNEFIIAEAEGQVGEAQRGLWFFANDRELALPAARIEATTRAADDGTVALTLRADTLVRDLVIAADRVSDRAAVDDNAITLLPGESRTVRITAAALPIETPAARWMEPPVFRCANEFAGKAM